MKRFFFGREVSKVFGYKAIGRRMYERACAVLLSILACSAYSQTYTFTTLAGTPGVPGTNDGINQDARFSFPVGVVPDKAGNLFVADFRNHAIRKLTRVGNDWVVTTIAGLPGVLGHVDGTNGDARFNLPAGITIDNANNLFVAERYNHTIRMVAPSGTNWVVSTVAGSAGVAGSADGTNTEAQFYLPSGITIDASNHLYVADTANFTIRELTPMGTNWVVTTIAGTALNFGSADGANNQAQFNYPVGIACSSAGKLYVADAGNNIVRELTHSGIDWVVATIAGSLNPGTADGAGAFAGFNYPTGVAVDRGEALYVADQSNNSIRKITPSASGWAVSTLAGQPLHSGSADGTSTNALFKKPWGIAVDPAGNLFVTDWSNSTIRAGTPSAVAVPDLQILFANGQVVLTWPAWASNYVLETSAGLDAANGWAPVTNGITLAGETFVLTNHGDAGSGFYRLR